MTVSLLDSSAWREFRGAPFSRGIKNKTLHHDTAHLAKIADTSGKLHDCFVKLLPLHIPALLGEAIGWTLARAADVSCPPFASMVLVPLAELRKHIDLPSEMDGWDVCPAWCCEIVPGKSIRQVHKWLYFIALKKCLRSRDVQNIAAFDYWSDLKDRNFGNVIRSGNGGYIAIDHESILHDLLWLKAGMKFEERSLLIEAEKKLSSADLKNFHVEMALAADKHFDAVSKVRTEIDRLVTLIYPHLASILVPQVLDMLEMRAQKGWLAAEIGVIA